MMISRRGLLTAPSILLPALARAENDKVNVNSFLRDAASKPGGRELQMALEASAKTGKSAYIPAGCVVVLRDEQSVVLPTGSSLVGDGTRSVLTGVYTHKVTNCLLRTNWRNPVRNLVLRNFAIDRSGTGIEHGILLNGVDGLVVDRLSVSGVATAVSGILAVSSVLNATGNVSRLISRNILISNCYFNDCGNFGIQLGAVDGAIVRDCQFLRAFREAVGVEPEACDVASSISILRNRFSCLPDLRQGSETGVIVVTMTSGAAAIRKVYIAENTIEFGATSQGRVMPGIGLYGHIDALIEKNVIRNAAGPGIQLGNLFEQSSSCGPSASLVSGRLIGARVVDNQIDSPNMGRNVGGNGAAIYARGAQGTLIARNHVTGRLHTSDLVQDSGAKNNALH
jgi:hypothetical protein